MPDTRLILHVKGTESETTELPKDAVRTGLSEGKITNSQLIWSPADNAWKQASEHPALATPAENLILHVKGTESETRHVPKKAVRAGISQGQITHSQLIWSAPENAWKQVREMPELLPSQKLAPAPVHHAETPQPVPAAEVPVAQAAPAAAHAPSALTGTPKAKPTVAAVQPKIGSGAVPKVAAAGTTVPKVSVSGATPKVAVSATPKAASAKPKLRVSTPAGSPSARANAIGGRSSGAIEVEEDDNFHPFKWICLGLAGLILLILGGNYVLVQMPLGSKFGKSGFANVTIYSHLGAFIQPNVMVVHVPKTTKLTEDNLSGFLAALSKSTPQNPLTHAPFDRVALTSGWTAQYSFDRDSWKQLADLENQEFAQRKDFIVSQLDDAAGRPLFKASTLTEELQQAQRDKIWKEFVANFSAGK